ncbi:MAG: hypothetical protein ACTS5Y_11550 [Pollutimonas bauzanensis]
MIEAVISHERYSQLQLKEHETLVVRPRQVHIFLDQAA